jgi:hypothetical protein
MNTKTIVPHVTLDRVSFGIRTKCASIPHLPSYEIISDHRLQSKSKKPQPYSRLRKLRHAQTGTHVEIRYRAYWAHVYRAKLIVRAKTGSDLPCEEIIALLKVFPKWDLILMEVAFDFPIGSKVNRDYVQLHAKFGKSRVLTIPGQGDTLYFGEREAPKLVRAYRKEELSCFRVELELHARLIKKLRLQHFQSISQLASLLVPDHIRFVRLDFEKLKEFCTRRGISHEVVKRAKAATSLHGRFDILKVGGISQNLYRFLIPLRQNDLLRRALQDFVSRYTDLSTIPIGRASSRDVLTCQESITQEEQH